MSSPVGRFETGLLRIAFAIGCRLPLHRSSGCRRDAPRCLRVCAHDLDRRFAVTLYLGRQRLPSSSARSPIAGLLEESGQHPILWRNEAIAQPIVMPDIGNVTMRVSAGCAWSSSKFLMRVTRLRPCASMASTIRPKSESNGPRKQGVGSTTCRANSASVVLPGDFDGRR